MFKRLDEKLDRLLVQVTEVQKDVSRNTDDLAEHIRRTNLLEDSLSKTNDRQRKIITVCIFLGGMGSVYYWPEVMALLKIVI